MWPSEGGTEVLLTVSRPLLVHQDLGDRSSDQAVSPVLLDGADDVEGDLAGATLGVVGTSLVVVNQEGVDQNAGVPGRHTWRHTVENPGSEVTSPRLTDCWGSGLLLTVE